LADNHYKRVTNFAKEMLVWPDEIQVHKIKNPAFLSDVKPTAVGTPTAIGYKGSTRNSMDLSMTRGVATSPSRMPNVN